MLERRKKERFVCEEKGSVEKTINQNILKYNDVLASGQEIKDGYD